MAHADYDCCAVCDSKMNYSNDALTKDKICGSCIRDLRNHGIDAINGGELIVLMNESKHPLVTYAVLRSIGFKACFYPNDVDDAFGKLQEQAKVIMIEELK